MTTTYDKNNPETIQRMFGTIAKQYDRTNAILSFSLHKYWNRALVKSLAEHRPRRILDLCCGTGEITFTLLKHSPDPTQVFMLDFCPEMLDCARNRGRHISGHTLHFIQGDAQQIDLPNECVDAISVAYGVRNVKEPKRCFAEAFRVMRNGGRFGILELTRPSNPLLRMGHALYLKICLPLIGKLATSNRDAYKYLCTSIENFVDPDQVMTGLSDVGFTHVKSKKLMGGIATLITAEKN
jgi:demethylmenaquinone methyltransferase/2-methoxy-6-polyprenyl-1,4-benzoquinol methylase